MSSSYLVVSEHGDVLSSGRPIAPGDRVPTSAIDANDAHDGHLIDSGALVKPAATPTTSKPAKKEENA